MSDTQPAQVIRSAMGHFQKLLQARESAARGESIDNVMKRLRPPVHFSRATAFKAQAQRWSTDKLGEALDMLLEAELMMRKAGIAWLSSTHKSIEEIATTILRDIRPDRLVY